MSISVDVLVAKREEPLTAEALCMFSFMAFLKRVTEDLRPEDTSVGLPEAVTFDKIRDIQKQYKW